MGVMKIKKAEEMITTGHQRMVDLWRVLHG